MQLSEGQQACVDFQLHREVFHRVTGTVTGREPWPPILRVFDHGPVDYSLTLASICCAFEAWLPRGRFRLASQFTSVDGGFVGSAPVEVGDADVEGVAVRLMRRTRVEIPIEFRPDPAAHEDLLRQVLFLQLIGLNPDGSGDAGPWSTQSGFGRPAALRKGSVVAFSSVPYMAALTTAGNVYAKSITAGGIDLTREPLLIDPDRPPELIRVVVAEGASVEGVTRRNGEAGRAWVYAIPDEADGRLLQPVESDAEGKFRMQGLAPAGYLFFATGEQIALEMQDEAEIRYWHSLGQTLMLFAGKTASLDLPVHTQ
jgi:hypothetical protein